jgi:membrane protein YdbS with pleckstrin-like domain
MEESWTNNQVFRENLPELESVRFQKHPLRYRTLRVLIMTMVWSIPIIALTLVAIFSDAKYDWIPIVIILIMAGISFVSIFKGYKRRSYALRERDVTYKKGWLFFSTTTIPFNRIQHTEVSQGPLERRFELCSLKIYTAGGATSDLSIPGLEQAEAQELRDYIANKAAIYA